MKKRKKRKHFHQNTNDIEEIEDAGCYPENCTSLYLSPEEITFPVTFPWNTEEVSPISIADIHDFYKKVRICPYQLKLS